MSDEHWYRNIEWTPEIEAAFDTKLARTRRQKAQYLRIQGSILKDARPDIALKLLQRCIDTDEEFHVAHAHLDSAHAHIVLGDLDSAIESLEAAMEQERRFPMFRTGAPFSYCFVVAYHERRERYDAALAILDGLGSGSFASTDFEAEAARALILWERGRRCEARDAAGRALEAASLEASWIPGHPDVGVVPGLDKSLGKRLANIVASRAL